MDRISAERRSANMAQIRSRDSKPELACAPVSYMQKDCVIGFMPAVFPASRT